MIDSVRGYIQTVWDRRLERQLIGPIRTRLLYNYYKHKYSGAAPNPTKVIYVDPNNIRWVMCPPFFDSRRGGIHVGTIVKGGNWDQKHLKNVTKLYPSEIDTKRGICPINNWDFYVSSIKYLKGKSDWENTKRYNYEINANHTKNNAEKRSQYLDKTHNNICEKGYLTQNELKRKDPKEYSAEYFTRPEYNEVRINIARDGSLVFEDGRHRLISAIVHEVENIPVRIVVRHKEWQNIRYEVATAESTSDLGPNILSKIHHPDLSDVIQSNDSISYSNLDL